jgi:peptide/nickel transport system substrate-binding protein
MSTNRIIAAAAAMMLISCGGGESRTEGGGAGARKDRLVIAVKSSPTNLDPRVGNDAVSGRIHEICCSGLIKVTPNMDYAPDVAASWETPDDRTIIFKLNPNARFQNGKPVTAQDVKWTYDSLMDPAFTTSKKSGYNAVERIEAPDPQTVIFRLKEPNGGIFDNLTLGILPQGSDGEAMKTAPIGAGPYQVTSFRTDESVEMKAFPQYHGGAPKIANLHVRVIPDATTLILELQRGTIDLQINQIPFESVARFESSDKHKVVKEPGSVWQYLAFNLRDPILRKVEVRRAIGHAIDRQRIITDLLRGHGVLADTMFGQGHWARAEGLPSYPFDPNKAKQLLDQAGYPDPPGAAPRFTLSFKTSTDQEANLRAQMIQQMLQNVGVKVEIQSSEFGTFLEDVQKGNFQMYSLSRNGIQDPDFYNVIFHTSAFPPEGQNRGYYSNPRVDELITQGRATFDREKRKQIYGEIQKIIQEDMPYVSLYHQINVAVMDKNLQGYVMYPAGFWLGIPQMSWGS